MQHHTMMQMSDTAFAFSKQQNRFQIRNNQAKFKQPASTELDKALHHEHAAKVEQYFHIQHTGKEQNQPARIETTSKHWGNTQYQNVTPNNEYPHWPFIG